MAEAEAIGKGRRLYISKADIMKHGLTEGCFGCRCLTEGKRAQGHSAGCRTRLEADIAKTEDGQARLTTAYLSSERSRVFFGIISRIEFDFRRGNNIFEQFEFLVCSKFNHKQCGRTCACAVIVLTQFHFECCGVGDDSR